MTAADLLPVLMPALLGGAVALGYFLGRSTVGASRIAALSADRAPTDLLAGQVSGLAVEIGALASALDRQTDAMERSMKLAMAGVPQ